MPDPVYYAPLPEDEPFTPPAFHLVREAMTDELLLLLTEGQMAMLIRLLRDVTQQEHGEICIRFSGDRLFMSKKESFDAGHIVKPPD